MHPHVGLLVLEVKGRGIVVDGATGTWASIDRYGDREERDALGRAFTMLFHQEGLPPSDVVVLIPRNEASSRLPAGTRIDNRMLTWSDTPVPNEVRITTIHAFKGLESPVIMLAEGDRVPEYDSHDALLYVGLSRAPQHLIILGDLPEPRESVPA